MNTNKKIKQGVSFFLMVVFLFSCIYLFSGCGFKDLKIPEHECKECTYTSPFTTIEATDVTRNEEFVEFKTLKIINSYFPGFKWTVTMKGYKRKLKDETP